MNNDMELATRLDRAIRIHYARKYILVDTTEGRATYAKEWANEDREFIALWDAFRAGKCAGTNIDEQISLYARMAHERGVQGVHVVTKPRAAAEPPRVPSWALVALGGAAGALAMHFLGNKEQAEQDELDVRPLSASEIIRSLQTSGGASCGCTRSPCACRRCANATESLEVRACEG